MEERRRAKAEEIRVLAKNFLDLSNVAMLDDYKAKLLLTASHLTDAAKALEEQDTAQDIGT